MSYPWPSFGSFLFTREEQPIFGSDTGWGRELVVARAALLGAVGDSAIITGVRAAVRSFEAHLSPQRFTALEALLGTSATFTDWQSPDPDTRAALLTGVDRIQLVTVYCSDGVTRQRWRSRISLSEDTSL